MIARETDSSSKDKKKKWLKGVVDEDEKDIYQEEIKSVSNSTVFVSDKACRLWNSDENFFQSFDINHLRQSGPTCVSNVLAMLCNLTPQHFQKPFADVNTQCPLSWSDALKQYDKKLAYCSSDCRRLKYYLNELIGHDDLFTISFYTGDSNRQPRKITKEPDESGYIIGSHIIILHRNIIHDSTLDRGVHIDDYDWNGVPLGEYFAKRIFRVVPKDFSRGI